MSSIGKIKLIHPIVCLTTPNTNANECHLFFTFYYPPYVLIKVTPKHFPNSRRIFHSFRVTNKKIGRFSHCGVLEFVAEEGQCYMPHWVSFWVLSSLIKMMQNLCLNINDLIEVANTTLPLAKMVKLRPHETAFTQTSNPKAV